jgi:hypothetical protein
VDRDKLISILKGAAIAAAGAAVAVVANAATSGALGPLWSPVLGAVASVLVNALRKWAEG